MHKKDAFIVITKLEMTTLPASLILLSPVLICNKKDVDIKGPRNQGTMLQKHCFWPEIFLFLLFFIVQMSRKQKNCFSSLLRKWGNNLGSKYCFHNKCCVCAQTGKTIFPQQCFLIYEGLNKWNQCDLTCNAG